MPELAEVEYFRKQWDCGLNRKIVAVHVNGGKRIFRGIDIGHLEETLKGSTLVESRAHGKQMLFRFSKDAWLGVHLGMTGKLRSENSSDVQLSKHDHLALIQKEATLTFSDPRLFGRILFHVGKGEPSWWAKLSPSLLGKEFTVERLADFLRRHRKAPLKAILLMQNGFPGVGNWMADEILWRAKLHPKTTAGEVDLSGTKLLHKQTQFVCREALRIVGKDFSDPPKSWLFQHRWSKDNACPRCGTILKRATIGGRTTCWCPKCQPAAE